MQIKPTLLLSDLDGVYCNWAQGYVNYMESIGYKALHANPTVFSMTDIFPMLDKPWIHIKDYQQSEFYAGILPYGGANEAYRELVKSGVKIIAVSSCGLEAETVRMRTEFVAKQGVFSDMILLELGAPKLDVLKKFAKAAFIDDQPVVALEGVEAGHVSMLKCMPYNIDITHPQIARVSQFAEIKTRMHTHPALSIACNIDEPLDVEPSRKMRFAR